MKKWPAKVQLDVPVAETGFALEVHNNYVRSLHPRRSSGPTSLQHKASGFHEKFMIQDIEKVDTSSVDYTYTCG